MSDSGQKLTVVCHSTFPLGCVKLMVPAVHVPSNIQKQVSPIWYDWAIETKQSITNF
jgi:hypothetical protein